ncbi:MAG: nucleotide exchange factor GrpE [Terrimonas sp.]|nr:nucleotide exchange factor GrpE [Terrimonas sp.]
MKEEKVKDTPVTEQPENQVPNINADENISGSAHLNDPVAEESEFEKLREELQDAKDRLLRQAAEFDNYRKRTAKERLELIQTAGRDIITDLLDVLDDCNRAETQMNNTDNVAQIKEGTQLIFAKLRNLLAAKGLKPMECINKDFDPDMHEAITEIPAPNEKLKGKIVDEIAKGYYLNDKIIRHAKVVVGK